MCILVFVLTACVAEATAPVEQASAPVEGPGGKADSPFESGSGPGWEEVRQRCTPPASDEPILYANTFSWGYSIEDMGATFEQVYAEGRRLDQRAFYDEELGQFLLPTNDNWGGPVRLSERLLANVRMHIEGALARDYVHFIFFPDMGHSHLFIPQTRWDAMYADIPVANTADRYTAMFDDPELRVLYHTAEQLDMLDEEHNLLPDRHLQWRYFTRNLVGDNNYLGRLDLLRDLDEQVNTARDLEGHHYYGAGFNITATAQGCFPFEHEGAIYWFDLSLSDLPYESDGSGYDGF